MKLTTEQVEGLNVALNEAAWLGIDVDVESMRATVLLDVLTLPAEGPAPDETKIVLLLDGVSRVAASLRNGWWNDAEATVEVLSLPDLDTAVRDFGGNSIYGWEFINPPEEIWADWRERLSLDANLSEDPAPHVLDLFQERSSGSPRHLDLRVWFRELRVCRGAGEEVPLQEFIDGGVRWWDGLYAGDPRTTGKGIIPG
ncbi:hypothetical protein AB0L65_42800 [Nonomuraea sp. NPDC052116]|uniref:hypothetical protein n=1 Tax=Nonomuraea sp. NPDC052116 TaxID=3155665 RepID=UPI0034437D17